MNSKLYTANTVRSLTGIMRTIKILGIILFIQSIGVNSKANSKSENKFCPAQCQCLNADVSCRESGLIEIPEVPTSTIRLNLDDNRLSDLNDLSDNAPSTLQVLSVSRNEIRYLSSTTFSIFHNLQVLRLSRNLLTTLPADLFRNNSNLEILDLSHNYLSVIPDHVMSSLPALTSFNISYNRLTSPRLGLGFQQTRLLSIIDLSGNNFPAVESDAFTVSSHWLDSIPRHVNLSYCNIWHLSADALPKIQSLQSVSLEGNAHMMTDSLQAALTDLDVSTLHNLNLSNLNLSNILHLLSQMKTDSLKNLHLSHNRIVRIPKRTFFFLVNLQRLDLSHNEIASIDPLAGLSKLVHLNLAHNKIGRLNEMMFEGLMELRFLDLSHNSLSEISDEPFLNLFHLNHMDLSYNRIDKVSILSGLENLEVLLISENRISDIGFLKGLRRLHTFDVSQNSIDAIGSHILAQNQEVNIANFSGNFIVNISSTAFRQTNYKIIDLSRNKIITVSDFGWNTVETLHLASNSIKYISPNAFTNSIRLQNLHLENNKIENISANSLSYQNDIKFIDLSNNPLGKMFETNQQGTIFENLKNLESLRVSKAGIKRIDKQLLDRLDSLLELDMSYNQLSSLPQDFLKASNKLRHLYLAFNQLPSFDNSALRNFNDLEVTDVSGNPFQCTCDLVSLCSALAPGGVLRLRGSFNHCTAPELWRGVSLTRYCTDVSTTCHSSFSPTIMAAVSSGLLVVLLTLTVIACFCRKWKRSKTSPPVQKKGLVCANYDPVEERKLTSNISRSSDSCSSNYSGGSNTSKQFKTYSNYKIPVVLYSEPSVCTLLSNNVIISGMYSEK